MKNHHHNINILFTSAGRRVELIELFKQALKDLNLPGNIVVADCQSNIPTAFYADRYEEVPRIERPDYIHHLLKICQKHHIKLLVPLIDPELNLLALHREKFALLGVTVLISSSLTNQICFDKRNTAKFFQQIGVKTPAILEPNKILGNSEAQYPFLIKPANGSNSVGVTVVNNPKELTFFQDYIPNAIVQELMQGEEYTLDVLVDFKGRVRCVVPRLRLATRGGEISKGITVKNPQIIAAGAKVVNSLPGTVGCITVQCFLLPEGEIVFIEINPRFGGGVPLSIKAGANYPKWILQMLLNEKNIDFDGWQDGIVMLRHDESVFYQHENASQLINNDTNQI